MKLTAIIIVLFGFIVGIGAAFHLFRDNPVEETPPHQNPEKTKRLEGEGPFDFSLQELRVWNARKAWQEAKTSGKTPDFPESLKRYDGKKIIVRGYINFCQSFEMANLFLLVEDARMVAPSFAVPPEMTIVCGIKDALPKIRKDDNPAVYEITGTLRLGFEIRNGILDRIYQLDVEKVEKVLGRD